MTGTDRRKVLRASIAAAALSVGALTAADALRGTASHPAPHPAHLRGSAPLPYAQVTAFDLARDAPHRDDALRAAHQVVTAMDGGDIAAWLALGDNAIGPVVRPRHLKRMPTFPGDLLDPRRSHGDLLPQITGTSSRAVRDALQRTISALPQWTIRWRVSGVRPESRIESGRGLSQNPFHFTEGYGNPDTSAGVTERAAVRADQGEPTWTVGGSYQVIRIIRLATAFWDRDTLHAQERVIGRRQDGRWLDGTPARERAAFTSDPKGKITPLDAHVRRAAPDPRQPPPMVRRGYNYRRSTDDQGLIFSCFQRDLAQGFEAVQRRLQDEAMAKYTLTIGGGYFFVPPPGDSWLDALT
ncbi:Dyp-type peroxidase [Streptomyces sp. NPDC001759]